MGHLYMNTKESKVCLCWVHHLFDNAQLVVCFDERGDENLVPFCPTKAAIRLLQARKYYMLSTINKLLLAFLRE